MAEFKMGHPNIPDGTHCCGKPAGCTNESEECLYRGTPVKPDIGGPTMAVKPEGAIRLNGSDAKTLLAVSAGLLDDAIVLIDAPVEVWQKVVAHSPWGYGDGQEERVHSAIFAIDGVRPEPANGG